MKSFIKSFLLSSILMLNISLVKAQHIVPMHVDKIAFGSCAKTKLNPIWKAVLPQKPQLWVWLGDIVYGDTKKMKRLRKKYQIQKSKEGYKQLLKTAKIIGTWDDHDYGQNDGGKDFPKKRESKEELLRFLDIKKSDALYHHDGVYDAYTFGSGTQKVKVILLDTRYFRDKLEPANDGINRYKPNHTGTILGQDQWVWLEKELKNSDAQFHIIASSIQLISSKHPYEKWANFPNELNKFYRLLQKTKPKRTIIISGDRHMSEISSIHIEGLGYELIDFTASGMTHTWTKKHPEYNPNRLGKLVIAKNFGMLLIDWSKMTLRLKTIDDKGTTQLDHTISFDK